MEAHTVAAQATQSAARTSSERALDTAIVLGARNLGGAIARDLLATGTRVATVARTADDLERLAGDGAHTLQADASDEHALAAALRRSARDLGGDRVDLIVDAISAARPPGDGTGFGGGPLLSASLAGLEAWTMSVITQSFVTLRAAATMLRGTGGTLVEIVGAPARRADVGRGLIAAGSAAVRALTHAAAAELRGDGVHVALLIVDGIIESPKTAGMTSGMAPEALVRQEDVAAAVRFLASQNPRAMTHELTITPGAAQWLP